MWRRNSKGVKRELECQDAGISTRRWRGGKDLDDDISAPDDKYARKSSGVGNGGLKEGAAELPG